MKTSTVVGGYRIEPRLGKGGMARLVSGPKYRDSSGEDSNPVTVGDGSRLALCTGGAAGSPVP